jgi:hypothetical protein
MEEAPGTQLGEIWDDMTLTDKSKIAEKIVAIEKKFMSVSFTRYVPPNHCAHTGIVNVEL